MPSTVDRHRSRYQATRRKADSLVSKLWAIIRGVEAAGRQYLTPREVREFDRIEDEALSLAPKLNRRHAALQRAESGGRRTISHRRRQVEEVERDTAPPPPGQFGSGIRLSTIHEAAHACVLAELGKRVHQVWLEYSGQRPTGRGWCEAKGQREVSDPRYWLAGLAAERIAAGKHRMGRVGFRRFVKDRKSRGDQDVIRAQRLVNRGKGPRGFKSLRSAWDWTVRTLRERWASLEKLADVLASTPGGSLDGERVHEVLADDGDGDQRGRLSILK